MCRRRTCLHYQAPERQTRSIIPVCRIERKGEASQRYSAFFFRFGAESLPQIMSPLKKKSPDLTLPGPALAVKELGGRICKTVCIPFSAGFGEVPSAALAPKRPCRQPLQGLMASNEPLRSKLLSDDYLGQPHRGNPRLHDVATIENHSRLTHRPRATYPRQHATHPMAALGNRTRGCCKSICSRLDWRIRPGSHKFASARRPGGGR
jgi:hypothetical protein